MSTFLGGLRLSGLFYEEAVRPVLQTHFPELRHSAGLIGYGSEVLGYDSPRSTDHEWGPRLLLFLSREDHRARADRLLEILRHELPCEFGGYPTHFGEPDEEGVRLSEEKASGPVDHKVEVHTVGASSRRGRVSILSRSGGRASGCACRSRDSWRSPPAASTTTVSENCRRCAPSSATTPATCGCTC